MILVLSELVSDHLAAVAAAAAAAALHPVQTKLRARSRCLIDHSINGKGLLANLILVHFVRTSIFVRLSHQYIVAECRVCSSSSKLLHRKSHTVSQTGFFLSCQQGGSKSDANSISTDTHREYEH